MLYTAMVYPEKKHQLEENVTHMQKLLKQKYNQFCYVALASIAGFLTG